MARVRALAIPVLVLCVLAWSVNLRVAAQETKKASGTVTSLAADSVTVKVAGKDMKFNVDTKTEVVATGAGTKARQAQAAGKAGPKLADVVKPGMNVEVTYHDTNGVLHASRVRSVLDVKAPGDEKPPTKTTSGTVKSVAADSLTVTAAGKDMTFAVDGKTNVVATGAGTKAAAKGGKTSIVEIVSAGDRVSVTYHETGSTMHAANVRVTSKGKPATK